MKTPSKIQALSKPELETLLTEVSTLTTKAAVVRHMSTKGLCSHTSSGSEKTLLNHAVALGVPLPFGFAKLMGVDTNVPPPSPAIADQLASKGMMNTDNGCGPQGKPGVPGAPELDSNPQVKPQKSPSLGESLRGSSPRDISSKHLNPRAVAFVDSSSTAWLGSGLSFKVTPPVVSALKSSSNLTEFNVR